MQGARPELPAYTRAPRSALPSWDLQPSKRSSFDPCEEDWTYSPAGTNAFEGPGLDSPSVVSGRGLLRYPRPLQPITSASEVGLGVGADIGGSWTVVARSVACSVAVLEHMGGFSHGDAPLGPFISHCHGTAAAGTGPDIGGTPSGLSSRDCAYPQPILPSGKGETGPPCAHTVLLVLPG